MCLICIDWARGALQLHEARHALSEMRDQLPPEHLRELEEKLDAAEEEAPTLPSP